MAEGRITDKSRAIEVFQKANRGLVIHVKIIQGAPIKSNTVKFVLNLFKTGFSVEMTM